ncbi:hypothetical protein KUCAC02_034324, partial [Chaenocephalus aceratus]
SIAFGQHLRSLIGADEFYHQPLKQGPNSPHTYAYFPGVPGKYVYCPSRVFSLYNAQGMEKEMTWPDFQ